MTLGSDAQKSLIRCGLDPGGARKRTGRAGGRGTQEAERWAVEGKCPA